MKKEIWKGKKSIPFSTRSGWIRIEDGKLVYYRVDVANNEFDGVPPVVSRRDVTAEEAEKIKESYDKEKGLDLLALD